MFRSTENRGRFHSSQGVMEGRTLERNGVNLKSLQDEADGLEGTNGVDLKSLLDEADGLEGRPKEADGLKGHPRDLSVILWDMAEANPWSREEEATRKSLGHLRERLESHFEKGKELNEATRKRRDRAIAKIDECEARLAQVATQRRAALKQRQIEAAMDAPPLLRKRGASRSRQI